MNSSARLEAGRIQFGIALQDSLPSGVPELGRINVGFYASDDLYLRGVVRTRLRDVEAPLALWKLATIRIAIRAYIESRLIQETREA